MKKKILIFFIATVTAVCCLVGLSACSLNAQILNFELNADGRSYRLSNVMKKGIKKIRIPSDYKTLPVTAIGSNALVNCTALREVTIPDSIMRIGYGAFQYCTALESISFPSRLTDIDKYAFYGSGLSGELIIPDTVTMMEEGAFSNCNGLTSIIVGDGLTDISREVFSGCENLKSITISASVTSIDEYAIENCSKLNSIIYKGTKTQWEKIKKDRYWDFFTGHYTVHCTDGDISK